MRFTEDGIPNERSTGGEFDLAKWILRADCAKGTKEDVKKMNTYLDTLEHKVADIHLQRNKNGEDTTAEFLKHKCLGKDILRKSLLAVFLEHNPQMFIQCIIF